MKLLALVATLIVALGFPPSARAAPGQFGWIEMGHQIQYPVEQQTEAWYLYDETTDQWYLNPDHSTWADNPSDDCVWDIDDQLRYWQDPANDKLGPNSSASKTVCQYADHRGRLWLVVVIAPSPNLRVTLEMDSIGETFTVRPVKTGGNQWTYTGCVAGPVYGAGSPAGLPEVPDSNGGFAVYDEGTLTISNNTSKTIRSIVVDFHVGRQVPYSQVCASQPHSVFYDDQYGAWHYDVGLT